MTKPLQCRICSDTKVAATLHARERMFGLGGDFIYNLCESCSSLSLSAFDDDLSEYYLADYYSFSDNDAFSLKAKLACLIGRYLPNSLASQMGKYSYSIESVTRVRAEILQWLERDLRAPRILDVGCGSGTALLRYHYAGCNVEGLDPYFRGQNPAEFSIHRIQLDQLTGS